MGTQGMLDRDAIRSAVVAAIAGIAPEADPAALAPDANLREACDLDSMDFLNFALALHRELGVDIPEADYGKIATLDGCVGYLAARLLPSP